MSGKEKVSLKIEVEKRSSGMAYKNMIIISRLRVELSTLRRLVEAANSFTVHGNERAFEQMVRRLSEHLLLSFSLLFSL